ncbi:MAG: radical SAM protein [Candidatus Methanoplasma sp.]|jgi:7-carboxy-7-deazaguanine synthase|nr:radical SAM protein [Candidatus Methanoplasma sp.]
MRVCEHFRSIQGEGLMMGAPTYFVRTVGCNLSCSWCDTKYAMEGGIEMSLPDIMEKIGDLRNVCLTGGEPLLQADSPELLEMLRDSGKRVVLETNGSIDVSRMPNWDELIISMDIKCPSSGMSDRMLMSNILVLAEKDQLKFIISDNIDLNHATMFMSEHPSPANVIFSPVGGIDLKTLAESVITRGLDVRVLPQLHKIIWDCDRGV